MCVRFSPVVKANDELNIHWWNERDLNPRSSACKADAFPTKLSPHRLFGFAYPNIARNFLPFS